jgi:propanol-preferring alcohol dehydrogenase
MKAAVLSGFREPLTIEDRERPVAGPGEIVIRVHACGVCHSDLHVADGDWDAVKKITRLPVIPGHEIAGDVAEVGRDVNNWSLGDRAGLPWLYETCGQCHYCARGQETLCAKQTITGVMVDGGFAGYVKAKATHATRIPPGLDYHEAAPLFCAGLTVYRALRQSEVAAGQTLAVYGIGGLGHLAVQLGRIRGAEVAAVDVRDEKLDLARELGASVTVNTAMGEKTPRADAAIVCSASAKAYEAALRSLKRGGALVVVGMPAETIALDAVNLVGGELRILSSAVGTRQELAELLDIAASGQVRCRIESHPFENVGEIFNRMRRGQIAGRAVLDTTSGW